MAIYIGRVEYKWNGLQSLKYLLILPLRKKSTANVVFAKIIVCIPSVETDKATTISSILEMRKLRLKVVVI